MSTELEKELSTPLESLDDGSIEQAESQEMSKRAGKYKAQDWEQLFSGGETETDWLVEPVIEAGTINLLYGDKGCGKSLFTLLELVMRIAETRHVIYLDNENRPREDIVTRLMSAGCGQDDVGNLHLFSFLDLPPLDSDDGGKDLEALAVTHDACLVVIDTAPRFVRGDENTADTWNDVYRYSLVRLKKRGIAVLLIDHSGKDRSRGTRGSSAKETGTDTVWQLTDESGNGLHLLLTCRKSRGASVHLGESIRIDKHVGPTRFEWDETSGNAARGDSERERIRQDIIKETGERELSGNQLEGIITGKRATIRSVRDELVGSGLLAKTGEGPATRYRNTSPFPEGDIGAA